MYKSSGVMYLNSGGVKTTGELLDLTLHTLDDWHGEQLLVHPTIELQNLKHLSMCSTLARQDSYSKIKPEAVVKI